MLLPITRTLSTKGQLVIPSKVRQALGLKPGTKVSIVADMRRRTIQVTPVANDPIESATGFLAGVKSKGAFKRILKEKYAEIKRGE